MDETTREMRLASWKPIIEKCNSRPDGKTARQWLAEQGINEKQYYYWQRCLRKEVHAQLTKSTPASVEVSSNLAFAEIPLMSTTVNSNSFKPDAIIRTSSVTIELSNSVSDRLLSTIMGGISHAQ